MEKKNDGEKLKRYLIFQFPLYYPAGGWNDFRESVDDPSKMKTTVDCRFITQIIDVETGKKINI